MDSDLKGNFMPLGNALDLQFTINQLIYANSATSIIGLATAANGVLITSAGSVPSISSTLPAAVQLNITQVGTIVTGVWNGSLITGQFGGTGVNNGASTFTMGGNVAFVGAFTFAGTLTGNTAVTFPTSGTLATTSGASGIVNPGLINQLAYYAANGSIVSGLATAASGTLVTDAGGIPSISSTLPSTVQLNITQVGILTAGTWNATNIGLNHGGTNAALTASNGGIFYSTATAGAILAGTATANQILMSQSSTAPIWSTATYPATTVINQILYSSATNTVTGLSSANSAHLVTTSMGIPVMTATMTNGQVVIGSTGATPTAATLTPGAGVSITNAAASITIAASGALKSFTYLTSGTAQTYTVPAGINHILVEAIGGGGGGGGVPATTSNVASAGGGGAGAYCRSFISTSPAATFTYTVGGGGAGGATGSNSGVIGNATTFGGSISAGGGVPGGTAVPTASAGAFGSAGSGGTGTGADLNLNGAAGTRGLVFSAQAGLGGQGGPGFYGGNAISAACSGSTFPGNSGIGNSGAGGGGATSGGTQLGNSGGNGATGLIIVWEFS